MKQTFNDKKSEKINHNKPKIQVIHKIDEINEIENLSHKRGLKELKIGY